jgi:hypothetical protein
MEAARTSETSVDNYFTRQYIPEDNSELHTRRRENLKSHITSGLIILSRNQMRLVVGLLTGHCHQRKHLHRLGIYKEEPVFRKCGMGEETAHHILFECEALSRIRYSVAYSGPPDSN